MLKRSTLVVVALALAGCGSPTVSTVPPSASIPEVSTSPEESGDAPPFDFLGTAWRVETIDGQPVPVGTAPTLAFDARDGAKAFGVAFSGCTEFGFEWALDGGQAEIRPRGVDLGTCTGIADQVESAFLARLVGANNYTQDGDVVVIGGPAGQLGLRRDVPPAGDPGRPVIDALRSGAWRVLKAPGIPAGAGAAGIRFTDTGLISVGECGFSGRVHFRQGGAVTFEEIGWDTTGCNAAQNAARDALKRLLESSTTMRLGAGGTVVISGPNGEVVLGH